MSLTNKTEIQRFDFDPARFAKYQQFSRAAAGSDKVSTSENTNNQKFIEDKRVDASPNLEIVNKIRTDSAQLCTRSSSSASVVSFGESVPNGRAIENVEPDAQNNAYCNGYYNQMELYYCNYGNSNYVNPYEYYYQQQKYQNPYIGNSTGFQSAGYQTMFNYNRYNQYGRRPDNFYYQRNRKNRRAPNLVQEPSLGMRENQKKVYVKKPSQVLEQRQPKETLLIDSKQKPENLLCNKEDLSSASTNSSTKQDDGSIDARDETPSFGTSNSTKQFASSDRERRLKAFFAVASYRIAPKADKLPLPSFISTEEKVKSVGEREQLRINCMNISSMRV